jgi:tetratricopeptide (TPR) repeat protein
MNKHQSYSLLAFSLLFLLLLFGFATKPKTLLQQEKERSLNLQSTDVSIIRDEAMAKLSGDERSMIQILQSKESQAEDTLARIEVLKDLSRTWYQNGQYALAGHYAEQIALLNNSGDSWGIAGTTYAIGIKGSTSEKEQRYCRDKAVEALESAISIDPDKIDHQLNRAIVLAEHPDSDNPMKGILILIELNKKFPENVPVMNNLAKFALQTNQLDKAIGRLTTALALDPDNKTTICLLAEAYEKVGDMTQSKVYKSLCEQK